MRALRDFHCKCKLTSYARRYCFDQSVISKANQKIKVTEFRKKNPTRRYKHAECPICRRICLSAPIALFASACQPAFSSSPSRSQQIRLPAGDSDASDDEEPRDSAALTRELRNKLGEIKAERDKLKAERDELEASADSIKTRGVHLKEKQERQERQLLAANEKLSKVTALWEDSKRVAESQRTACIGLREELTAATASLRSKTATLRTLEECVHCRCPLL